VLHSLLSGKKRGPNLKPVILAAKRTPIGSFLGAFKDVSAVELGTAAASAVLAGLDPTDVADVIVGNVIQAGQGMNPARQIALKAKLPVQIPAQTINRVCGSGMQAVISAVHGLRAGDGPLYIAGGTESMSRAPFLAPHMRAGHKMGDSVLWDSLIRDGLTDPIYGFHMGITAENIAAKWNISREEQDAFAVESHRRAADAQRGNLFGAEIVSVDITSRRDTITVNADEGVRPEASPEVLAKLKPAFQPEGGTVTAGNASTLNDGAAMLAIADERYALAHGLKPLAEILSYATIGLDPNLMGIGPAVAIPLALKRAGLDIPDIDLFELNEAFSAQSIAVCRDLHLDRERVNVSGGALALGHPIGASGARIVVTLIHALRTRCKTHGVASLCIGGGMGIALVIRISDR